MESNGVVSAVLVAQYVSRRVGEMLCSVALRVGPKFFRLYIRLKYSARIILRNILNSIIVERT